VEIPSACAKAAKKAGVRHVSLMTVVGADVTETESWLTGTAAGGGLYLHLKGLVAEYGENGIRKFVNLSPCWHPWEFKFSKHAFGHVHGRFSWKI